MKKIVDGKKYDTDTAALVAEWDNGKVGTFDFVRRDLHQKRNGEFFLHCEGGPNTRYATRVRGSNSWTGGEAIEPLTFDEAREWAERSLDADAYEAIFGEVPEDDESVIVSLRIPASAKAILDRECARSGRPRGEIVAELLGKLQN